MIQDLSGSWCIKGTGESTLVMDSLVPLMHYDPDRSWITDPDPDHPKGTNSKYPYKFSILVRTLFVCDQFYFVFISITAHSNISKHGTEIHLISSLFPNG